MISQNPSKCWGSLGSAAHSSLRVLRRLMAKRGWMLTKHILHLTSYFLHRKLVSHKTKGSITAGRHFFKENQIKHVSIQPLFRRYKI